MSYENKIDAAPTAAQATKFDMLDPLLDSLIQEMREFAKKKQDGIVNSLKIKMINRLLNDLREILATDPTLQYLEVLVEAEAPQNSDAVLILGQYRAAMNQYRTRHSSKKFGEEGWWTKERYQQRQQREADADRRGRRGRR